MQTQNKLPTDTETLLEGLLGKRLMQENEDFVARYNYLPEEHAAIISLLQQKKSDDVSDTKAFHKWLYTESDKPHNAENSWKAACIHVRNSLSANNKEKESEWISVNDRLPDVDVLVITYPYSMVTIRHLKMDGDDKVWFFDALPVTHWRHLPSQPIDIQ